MNTHSEHAFAVDTAEALGAEIERGTRLLGVAPDEEPATIVAAVDAFVYAWQCGDRPPPSVLDAEDAAFILEAAHRIVQQDLDLAAIRTMPDDEARERLLSIKGFGPWSVEMFMIFALDRRDVFSVGDAGLRRAVCMLYGIPKARYESRALRLAEAWRPYRSFACRYLWGWLDTDDAKLM